MILPPLANMQHRFFASFFRYSGERKNFHSFNEAYFWTSVIKDWKHPLAILISDRKMALEKIGYMHCNPLQPHWQLCNDPIEYRFSSAKFYDTEEDEFKMLTH